MPRRDELRPLEKLRKHQSEITEAAADFWGALNEEAGAKLLAAFLAERRIQGYVLAARGSYLDTERHTDAVLHLWDEKYLPINFKSSQTGKRIHDSWWGKDIPALVVNSATDPEFKEARASLLRLIETWYGNMHFSNEMVIPCFRRITEENLIKLKGALNEHLEKIKESRAPLSAEGERAVSLLGVHALQTALGKKCVFAKIFLEDGTWAPFNCYLGAQPMAWLGKERRILIVTVCDMGTDDFQRVLAEGIRKSRSLI